MEPKQATCLTTVVDFWGKGPPFRAVIGLVCVLSVIGSLLIIFSYVFYKSLRSRARLILVHLSIVDFGVGLSNLAGNIIYFDQFYFTSNQLLIHNQSNFSDYDSSGDGTEMPCVSFHQPDNIAIRRLCISQAFIAHYFTQASILWTICLAVFLYLLIVRSSTNLAKYSLRLSYVLCYLLPLVICMWLLLTDRFGYSPANTGWCSILIINAETNQPDIYAAVFGYDLWIYLGMILVPILYIAVQLYIREKLKQTQMYLPQAEGRFWEAVYILDYNFLLIPIIFTLLRMWTCIVDILFVYIQLKQSPLWMNLTFVYLAGIGDSGQGAANAVLFVLLTKRVRTTIFSLSYWKMKLRLHGNRYDWIDKGEIDPLFKEKAGIVNGESYQEPEIFTPARASADESNIFVFPIDT